MMMSVWLSGCQTGVIDIERKAQADTTPPVIINLDFPDPGSFLPEGSVVITGTLVDPAEEGSGFSRDRPICLDIEVWGGLLESTTILLEPVRTQRFIINDTYPEYHDPSFFDHDTGEFRIELGDHLRLKPGVLVFHLYGEDASGNVYGPITANVISGDIPGADLAQLYAGRQQYGDKLLALLGAFNRCLAIYGSDYEEDIAVLGEFYNFIQNTYVDSPGMETWSDDMDTLVSNIHQMDYPDPLVQLGMDIGVDTYKEWYEDIGIYINSYPYYPYDITQPEIVDLRQKIVDRYTNDVFIIDFEPLPPPAEGLSCHIVMEACDLPQHENMMMDIADFTITSDPTQDLLITGYIGWEGNRVYLEPDDYDPPIKVLVVFVDTAVEGTFTKFW
ncbi:hypothetical protein KAU08_03910 [bacterium]|nr:hypothetical protein [bacterium]